MPAEPMERAQIEIVGGAGDVTTAPPDPIRVGGGTAFYVGGTMPPGVAAGARVRAGSIEFPIDAHSMPEERRYERGELWWTMVTVPGDAPLAAGDPPRPEPLTDETGARIAICMATWEPDPARLRVQLDSIRAQSRDDWVCVISDDCSSPEAFAAIEREIAGDARFLLSRAPERLGFLRNFERAIGLAPASAELIALADQDDRWDEDKLDVLAAALDRAPDALLAYSDVRIADSAGRVLSDTYFFERRNNAASMASMLITNNVTGAASMFRRELLATALPFPPGGTGQELYHDHWLALCALAQGPLAYVDRPTHDYTRHDASVTVSDAEGHWVAPPRGRLGALSMRLRRYARRLRLASRSPGWRTGYVGRYLLIRQLGTILLLRLGRERIAPRHLRDIDRLLAAETSPAAALWLLARSFRPWIGRNDTLGRERVVFGGILWRKLAGRRGRRRA
jgi:glycosyltransferase involved in cell wall biosynthesis